MFSFLSSVYGNGADNGVDNGLEKKVVEMEKNFNNVIKAKTIELDVMSKKVNVLCKTVGHLNDKIISIANVQKNQDEGLTNHKESIEKLYGDIRTLQKDTSELKQKYQCRDRALKKFANNLLGKPPKRKRDEVDDNVAKRIKIDPPIAQIVNTDNTQ